ncbi:MAG: hypothetical protein AAF546_10720, partial [Verrucomicrobiota bacterium]
TKLAGGNAPLSISLTAVTSLLSILIVPWAVAWSVSYFEVTGSHHRRKSRPHLDPVLPGCHPHET